MASQFGVAGGIPERRVRPVWDAIESRQFKNAFKLIASVLSKYPSSPYALALKALVLERTGKCDDALSVCVAAKELLLTSDPLLMDDLTLSTLQIVLQRLDHLELATSCYENACAKFPKNLELMMGLFNCYVREYSFVKQQQTAIKMYKIAGEERFLLWAVCSIQLQVLCGNGEEKLLSLAEGLLKKHIASHSLHEPEALIVYISLLEHQAKYCDAFEVLCGKLGSLIIIEVDKLRMQGRLLARSGDYAAAALIFQKVLESCPDDWGCFLHYLSCLLEDDNSWCNLDVNDPIHPPKCVNCQFSHLTNDSFLSRISDALAFVQKLQAETNNDGIRGPYLAYLEIGRRKRLYGKEDDGSLVDALVQYFSRFGHLACFVSDLEEFLQDLYPDEKTELIEKLWKCCNSSTTQPTEVLGRSISLLKVEQLIGDMFKLSVAELYISVTEMLQLYCKTLALSKDLDPQESMYGEELLSMACNTLVQLFWRTGNLGYLLEAVIILEFGLTIRGCIWQYKILALHLYSYLGAFKLAYEWYKSLDVKNILLETVSHHIFRQLLTSPLWADLGNLYNDYLRFMDDHLRESADLTFLAYRHRSYSKVVEFVQFKQRLERSNQYLLAKIESPILHLKQNADNVEEEEHVLESLQYGVPFIQLSSEIGSRALTFNEDLQSRPWWTPTPEENHLSGPFKRVSYRPKENLTEERERNARKTIEKRSLLPRMIHLSIQCAAAASLRENVEDNGTTSADLKFSTEMKSLLERYANILGYTFGDAIETITGVSSGTTSAEVLGEDAIDWTNFAVFLNAWNLASREHGLRTWHIFNSLSENLIGAKLRSTGTIISANGSDLAHLFQMITEPLAWHGLVLQTCVRSILPSGKKKKKTGAADHSNSELCRAVQASLESVNETLEEVMKWLRERRLENDAPDFMLSFLQQKEGTEGPGRVFQLLVDFTSFMDETEVGARIFENLKLWSPLDAVRKTAADKCAVLSMFLNICESKYKFLRALRQQMAAHSHT